MGPRLEEDGGANGRRWRAEWQGGEGRGRVQTARPLKGRCGWQPLTLVTTGFHQRPLMKADCRGTVREPRGRKESKRERARERKKD